LSETVIHSDKKLTQWPFNLMPFPSVAFRPNTQPELKAHS